MRKTNLFRITAPAVRTEKQAYQVLLKNKGKQIVGILFPSELLLYKTLLMAGYTYDQANDQVRLFAGC